MDVNEDIYGDLPTETIGERIEKLETEIKTLKESLEKANIALSKCQNECNCLLKENKGFKQLNEILLRNSSSLFNTAIAEIRRKDECIRSLREEYENFHFRRSKAPFRAEYSNPTRNRRPDRGHESEHSQDLSRHAKYEDCQLNKSSSSGKKSYRSPEQINHRVLDPEHVRTENPRDRMNARPRENVTPAEIEYVRRMRQKEDRTDRQENSSDKKSCRSPEHTNHLVTDPENARTENPRNRVNARSRENVAPVEIEYVRRMKQKEDRIDRQENSSDKKSCRSPEHTNHLATDSEHARTENPRNRVNARPRENLGAAEIENVRRMRQKEDRTDKQENSSDKKSCRSPEYTNHLATDLEHTKTENPRNRENARPRENLAAAEIENARRMRQKEDRTDRQENSSDKKSCRSPEHTNHLVTDPEHARTETLRNRVNARPRENITPAEIEYVRRMKQKEDRTDRRENSSDKKSWRSPDRPNLRVTDPEHAKTENPRNRMNARPRENVAAAEIENVRRMKQKDDRTERQENSSDKKSCHSPEHTNHRVTDPEHAKTENPRNRLNARPRENVAAAEIENVRRMRLKEARTDRRENSSNKAIKEPPYVRGTIRRHEDQPDQREPFKYMRNDIVNLLFKIPKQISPIANTPDYLKEKLTNEENKLTPVIPMINATRVLDTPVVALECKLFTESKENTVNQVASVIDKSPYKNCGILEITSDCIAKVCSMFTQNSTTSSISSSVSFSNDIEQGEFKRKGRKRPAIVHYNFSKNVRAE